MRLYRDLEQAAEAADRRKGEAGQKKPYIINRQGSIICRHTRNLVGVVRPAPEFGQGMYEAACYVNGAKTPDAEVGVGKNRVADEIWSRHCSIQMKLAMAEEIPAPKE